MTFTIPNERIAVLINSPAANVTANWPVLEAAISQQTEVTNFVAVAAISTVRVECPPFKPIREFGNTAYFTKHYEGRADLGNTQAGDGARFCGRGYLQITGRKNYQHYGDLIGADLIGNPDLALDPIYAAEIFALYFKTRGCFVAANNQDWKKVRQLVNGGYNGLDAFMVSVNKLLSELKVQAST